MMFKFFFFCMHRSISSSSKRCTAEDCEALQDLFTLRWIAMKICVRDIVHRPVCSKLNTPALNWTINFDERSLSSPMRSLSMSHLNTKSCSLLCLPCAQEEGRGRRLNIYSGSVKKVMCTFLRCTKRIAKSNEEQSSSTHYTWGDIETSNKEKLRIILEKQNGVALHRLDFMLLCFLASCSYFRLGAKAIFIGLGNFWYPFGNPLVLADGSSTILYLPKKRWRNKQEAKQRLG